MRTDDDTVERSERDDLVEDEHLVAEILQPFAGHGHARRTDTEHRGRDHRLAFARRSHRLRCHADQRTGGVHATSRGAAEPEETDMTPLIDTNMTQETRYETPTFDPRSAFARTLRGGEMARLGHLARQKEVAASSELGGSRSNTAEQTNGTERHYETPTFDPRGAFAWTLRGGEMARLELRRRLFDQERPNVLASGEPFRSRRPATA
jgi:hypothetical protein